MDTYFVRLGQYACGRSIIPVFQTQENVCSEVAFFPLRLAFLPRVVRISFRPTRLFVRCSLVSSIYSNQPYFSRSVLCALVFSSPSSLPSDQPRSGLHLRYDPLNGGALRVCRDVYKYVERRGLPSFSFLLAHHYLSHFLHLFTHIPLN